MADEMRELPDGIALGGGAHTGPDDGMCVMEAAAWIAGEPWSDHPVCVSPIIGAFCRSWNDSLSDDDRTRLLLPYVRRVIGTRTTDADETARAWLATDWLVRTYTPAWLRLAGLPDHALALASLPPLTDAASATAAQPTIAAAGDAARDAAGEAAWDAAWAAAGDAAGNAAGNAARDAARDAAWDAAWAATWAAAWAAAWAAERDAAREALRPTVTALQLSACDLLNAMIAVGRTHTTEARND